MKTYQRYLACLIALLLCFGAWYVSDPQMALLQAPDAEHGPRALYRLAPYITYVMTVWVTWLSTAPQRLDPNSLK